MATNAAARPVIQNILTSRIVGQKDTMYMVFRSEYTPSPGFRVILSPYEDIVTAGILVNKVSDDRQMQLPSLDHADFESYKNNTSWVDETEIGGLYLITVIAPAGTEYSLMIRKDAPIRLNHAQIIDPALWRWSPDADDTNQDYLVSTAGQWILNMQTAETVDAIITTDQNTTIVETMTLNSGSQPF